MSGRYVYVYCAEGHAYEQEDAMLTTSLKTNSKMSG